VDTDEPAREQLLENFDRLSHLLAIGQFSRAKELAQQQLSSNPHDPSALNDLALVLLCSGDPSGALAASESALAMAPDWAGSWSIRSTSELRLGRFSAAERSILEAIRLMPDEARFFMNYARVLTACGKHQNALAQVRVALELDPDDDEAHRLFATLLHLVSPAKWRVSEGVAVRAVELDPDNDDAHAILGWIRLTAGRIDEAETNFRSSLELSPNNRLAISGLAHVVMAKAWWYRPFLWYSLAMSRFGTALQLFVVVGLWGIVSALHLQVTDPRVDQVISLSYLGFCAYTWFAEPITRGILRRRYDWL